MRLEAPRVIVPLDQVRPGLGAGDCHPLTNAFWGALALMFIPPFLSGLAEGARDAWRTRK